MSFTSRPQRPLLEQATRVVLEAARQKLARSPEGYLSQTPTEKQRCFLGLACFEALYGGSAGGGKSSCLLIGAISAAVAGGSVLVLRRTFADLSLPGAIMDRSHSFLQSTPAKWHAMDKRWSFPSGGVLQFGYLDTEKDKYRYQGAEFQQVYFDELTQFTETQYLYILSRIRKTVENSIPLKARSASNPGGIGHDWVLARFISDPQDRVFVPARLEDNPHLDQVSYRMALEKLDATTRAQLLEGLWVRDDGGQLYSYSEPRNVAETEPSFLPAYDADASVRYILGIDLGASSREPSTAFCVVSYSPRRPDLIVVEQSYSEADLIPSTVAERIKSLQRTYDFESIVCDAGALGKGYVQEFRRRHSLPVREAAKRDKLGYRKIVNGDFERGVIKVRTADSRNDSLVEELKTLEWDSRGLDANPSQKDHLTDCMLYALREAKAYAARAPDLAPQDPEGWAKWEENRMKKEMLTRKYPQSKNGNIRRSSKW